MPDLFPKCRVRRLKRQISIILQAIYCAEQPVTGTEIITNVRTMGDNSSSLSFIFAI